MAMESGADEEEETLKKLNNRGSNYRGPEHDTARAQH
jgi:hypothetical protein